MDQDRNQQQGANDTDVRDSDDSEAIRRTGGEDAEAGREAELRSAIGSGHSGEAAPSYASYGAHQEQERGGPGSDAALRSDTDRADVHPGGKWNTGAAGHDLPQNEVSGLDQHPDGVPTGGVQEGSNDPSTFNDQGRVVGPDSPAGDIGVDGRGDGQGDDLANRLGGEEGRGTGITGGGAATGDMRSASSDEADADGPREGGTGGPDAGSPGGLGGVHDRMQGSSRPPGGSSPGLQDSKSGRGD